MNRVKVRRLDGKMIQVVPKNGQLFVCAPGCCCGHAEDGFARIPIELYQSEREHRKLRNTVHLTQTACLGQCALANVVLLVLDGRMMWFHSIESEAQVLALFDYVESILEDNSPLALPLLLRDNVFDGFTANEADSIDLPVLSL